MLDIICHQETRHPKCELPGNQPIDSTRTFCATRRRDIPSVNCQGINNITIAAAKTNHCECNGQLLLNKFSVLWENSFHLLADSAPVSQSINKDRKIIKIIINTKVAKLTTLHQFLISKNPHVNYQTKFKQHVI